MPNDYKYNNKEYLDDLGLNMLDYGARLYDPLTVRWNGVDALAERYSSFSTYGYVGGNPMSRVDLDGREVYYTAGGTRLGQIGSSTQVVVVSDSYAKWALFTIYNFKDFSYEEESFHLDQLNRGSRRLGMTEEELNTRAMLSLLMTHESCKNKDDNPCEGKNDYKRYYAINGGGYLSSLATRPKGPAVGAYQITNITWEQVQLWFPGLSFYERNQDKAAVNLIHYTGAESAAQTGNVDAFINKASDTWVSLPGASQADSKYTREKARTIFRHFLVQELKGKSIVFTPQGQLPKSSYHKK